VSNTTLTCEDNANAWEERAVPYLFTRKHVMRFGKQMHVAGIQRHKQVLQYIGWGLPQIGSTSRRPGAGGGLEGPGDDAP
jgi:hypothetical protein